MALRPVFIMLYLLIFSSLPASAAMLEVYSGDTILIYFRYILGTQY